jgi:glycosyltransferase involved in cell wall biosynthesis
MRNTYLLVVGDDASIGQYRSRAKIVAGERVIFTGRQEAIERFYGAADLLVLPSIQEAFGNVVLEALASSLPVVVSRGAGAAEVLKGHAAQGIVNDPEASNHLTQKIAALLRRSAEPAYRVELRKLAEGYSWRSHFRQLEAALAEVRSAKQSERFS